MARIGSGNMPLASVVPIIVPSLRPYGVFAVNTQSTCPVVPVDAHLGDVHALRQFDPAIIALYVELPVGLLASELQYASTAAAFANEAAILVLVMKMRLGSVVCCTGAYIARALALFVTTTATA